MEEAPENGKELYCARANGMNVFLIYILID
jgi:hypothetical protein